MALYFDFPKEPSYTCVGFLFNSSKLCSVCFVFMSSLLTSLDFSYIEDLSQFDISLTRLPVICSVTSYSHLVL